MTHIRIPKVIYERRSIRRFDDAPLEPDSLLELVRAAATAPAPHHSRPWRFAIVTTGEQKRALATEMAAAWARDMAGDGLPPEHIEERTDASILQVSSAPALILACLTDEGLDSYPDRRRAESERGMAKMSLGAAVQNILLSVTESGLGAFWMAAPVFCPDEARAALDLPPEWQPQALILVGVPDSNYHPPARPSIDPGSLTLFR